MVNILFVCLGNICRSTMAEAVMRHKINQAGLSDDIAVDSAGTSNWHTGEPPHAGTRRMLKNAGISCEGIASRQLVAEDAERFDYIIAMDDDNVRDILQIAPDARGKTRLLSAFTDGSWRNVPDPWYTKDYNETYVLVNEGCDGLLAVLSSRL